MNTKTLIVAGIASLALCGCASQPDRIQELEQARIAVQEIDREPMAERVAGGELRQARQTLARAERAKEQNAQLDEIKHYAYLAHRHADIASERVGEAEAREQIERSESERTQVLLEARTREAELAAAEARQARTLAEARGAEAAERSREAEEQRLRADAAIQQAEELEEVLAELEAEQTERGLVLTLSDVLFDTDNAELKPGAESAVTRLAQFMADNEKRRLLIEGHTDARGEESYNRTLSEQRASAVREALVERGVPLDRLRAVGRGEAYPIATNETAAGRQQNRRVEIVVSDQNGEFPVTAERAAAM